MKNAGFVIPRNTLNDFPVSKRKLIPLYGSTPEEKIGSLSPGFTLVCLQHRISGLTLEGLCEAFVCEAAPDVESMRANLSAGKATKLEWFTTESRNLKL